MSKPAAILSRPGLSVVPAGPLGQVTLRLADAADPRLAAAVEAVAGVAPPAVRTATFAPDGRGAVWMSPDELLLLLPAGGAGAAVAALEAALAGAHHLALDVSEARVLFRLRGPDAAELLAKGAPVDLSDAGFAVGAARRTHLAQLAVVFWRREAELYEIACLRSFGHHLAAWLAASGVAGARVGVFARG